MRVRDLAGGFFFSRADSARSSCAAFLVFVGQRRGADFFSPALQAHDVDQVRTGEFDLAVLAVLVQLLQMHARHFRSPWPQSDRPSCCDLRCPAELNANRCNSNALLGWEPRMGRRRRTFRDEGDRARWRRTRQQRDPLQYPRFRSPPNRPRHCVVVRLPSRPLLRVDLQSLRWAPAVRRLLHVSWKRSSSER